MKQWITRMLLMALFPFVCQFNKLSMNHWMCVNWSSKPIQIPHKWRGYLPIPAKYRVRTSHKMIEPQMATTPVSLNADCYSF